MKVIRISYAQITLKNIQTYSAYHRFIRWILGGIGKYDIVSWPPVIISKPPVIVNMPQLL